MNNPVNINIDTSASNIVGSASLPVSKQGNGLAVAGFVCALVGFVLLAVVYVSIPLEVTGAVLSSIGLKRSKEREGKGRGLAIAGIVLASVGLAIFLLGILFFASLFSGLSNQ